MVIDYNTELITDNTSFYNSLLLVNNFGLFVYILVIFKTLINYKLHNIDSLLLSLIYIRYMLGNIYDTNYTMYEYEIKRIVMWLFSTPLMIKIYCDANNIHDYVEYILFNSIPMTLNIVVYKYRFTYIYDLFFLSTTFFMLAFLSLLHKNNTKIFTEIYSVIWITFSVIGVADYLQLISKYDINIYYLYADLISKITTNIIINDYNSKENNIKNKIDLQSINFISYMIENINEYIENNSIITENCSEFIENIKMYFHSKIPQDKHRLSQELLSKILPFGFDIDYITFCNISTKTKQFNMICISFIDIVNYTELAKKFDAEKIFDLLNIIYKKFDTILKKYNNIQKIETIGDAYMVIGDIYRANLNHKLVIKNMILFSLEILNEIKFIKTPDNSTLSARIGFTIGTVSIGILGNEIPRLCVVGNHVNKASRLQATADPDTIQVSHHIYELLDEIDLDIKLDITRKDNVFLKNIGSVTAYTISSNCLQNN